MRVVGFHYLGPHAGEVTQGYGLGIRLGATKHDFDSLIGIHPTSAEVNNNNNNTLVFPLVIPPFNLSFLFVP